MLSFSQFLTEQKNTHMEHLEDAVLNGGVTGARQAINLLRSMRDMLSGSSSRGVSTTVKWDGAPAIFAGQDPRDGQFFVAKKGVFAKNPKIYKTNAEVDADTSGDLADKLKLALKYLPELGITGVIQGDFLYSKSDLKTETYDGEKVITFHPNTIVYAVPAKSSMAKAIKASKMGIVWHTVYKGTSFETMKASFGKSISDSLKKSRNVWFVDPEFSDVSGKATFTEKETADITAELSIAGKTFQTINSPMLTKFLNLQNSFTGAMVSASLKTYNNINVRQGKPISNPRAHAQGYVKHVNDKYNDKVKESKSEAGKKKYSKLKTEYTREMNKHVKNLTTIITFQNAIVNAKMLVVKKLNSVRSIGTFIKTDNGFKVSNPEGYVAIDRVSGNAVKLVDRMEFSYNNFTAIKAWDK